MRMFRKQLAAYEEDVIRQVLVVHRPYTQSGVLDRCPTVFQDLHEVRDAGRSGALRNRRPLARGRLGESGPAVQPGATSSSL